MTRDCISILVMCLYLVGSWNPPALTMCMAQIVIIDQGLHMIQQCVCISILVMWHPPAVTMCTAQIVTIDQGLHINFSHVSVFGWELKPSSQIVIIDQGLHMIQQCVCISILVMWHPPAVTMCTAQIVTIDQGLHINFSHVSVFGWELKPPSLDYVYGTDSNHWPGTAYDSAMCLYLVGSWNPPALTMCTAQIVIIDQGMHINFVLQ